jgi:perosamine synthetase
MPAADPIPLAQPTLTDRAQTVVETVLSSGRLSRGPFVDAFEERMAERCGTAHAVAVSSGTAALHCIVRALDLSEGAEVITTPFSFVASTNALLYENLSPRFVDIDPMTYNIDVEAVEAALTPQTEALLAVDVFGVPAHWPALRSLADAHDLRLIDDACEALGAEIGDQPAGSWGDAGAFGFYPNKQITTGEGGCITTDDAALARTCRALRNHGRSGTGQMTHERLGYNYRLDELSAAVGCAQLDRLDTALDARAAVADRYQEALAPLRDDLVLPAVPSTGTRSWFVYVVRLRDHFAADARDQLMTDLQNAGIGCAPYFPAIHLQPFHQEHLGHAPGDFPVCEHVSRRTLALPFYEDLSASTIERVATALANRLPSLPRT